MTTTTAPAKPRRRRAKRARKPATVTMNQQTPLKVEIPTDTRPSLPEPYVQSHLSDIQLISRDALWNDLQNRMKINNRELGYAMADLKDAVSWTNEQIKKLLKKIETVEL